MHSAAGRRTAWAAVLLALLGFEFGVARNSAITSRIYTDSPAVLEREVLSGSASPRLVVFGNSRTLYGVHELDLAAALGLEGSAVAKLAMNGTTVADALYLYRTHRQKLSRADLFVIGIDAAQLANPLTADPKVLRYAGHLGVRDYPSPLWPQLTLCWGFRTSTVLRPLMIKSRQQAMHGVRRLRGQEPDQHNGGAGRTGVFDERDPETERMWASGEWYSQGSAAVDRDTRGLAHQPGLRWDVSVVNDRWCSSSEFSAAGLRQLMRLLDTLQADGARVLVVRWPLTDEYFDDLEARYPGHAAAFDAVLRNLQSYAAQHPNVEVRDYGRASQWGLDYRAFYDYGHPSPLGREFCTREIEEWAREHLAD